MADFSFDIECGFDRQELINSLDQARREIINRYDFKGVLADIEASNPKELVIHTESEAKVTAIVDIIESKLVKREIPLTVLDKSKQLEDASGGTVRKRIPLRDSLSQDDAKKITKLIRDRLPKVKPIIQGDTIRVTSKSKDELQETMQIVRSADLELPLKFTNYR